jgi:hypothetical protein
MQGMSTMRSEKVQRRQTPGGEYRAVSVEASSVGNGVQQHDRSQQRVALAKAGRWVRVLKEGLWVTAVGLLAACGGGASVSNPDPPVGAACLALPNEITWHQDTLSSEWTDVLFDKSGRLWVAGWTNGVVGQSNIEPSGNSAPVLRALAMDGRLLLDVGDRFDTPGTDSVEALALSATGTVYAAGRTTGQLGGTPNAGQFDTFVVWSDEAGSASSWRAFQTGSPAPQHPRRLTLGAHGELLIAGEDDDDVPSNYIRAWSDAFALELHRVDAGTANDRLVTHWMWQARSAEADLRGGLAWVETASCMATYVSGSNQSGAARGMVLRKLDAGGALVWTSRYSSSPVDHIAVVRALSDGTLLIGGTVFGSFRGAPSQGQQDVFVARVSAVDGQVMQSWQFGSSDSDLLADLQVDEAGNILLFGETTGSFAPGSTPAGETDLFLMKLAPDGRVVATRQWGTAGDERAIRLAADGCGGLVAVGSSSAAGRRDAITWFWRP